MIYDTVQLQMNKLEKKTGFCSISWVVLWKNLENTYFGHFLVENQDTGRQKSFCNSAQCTKPNLLNQLFPWGLNQIHLANFTKPNPPNWIYKSNIPSKMFKINTTKYTRPNLFNPIYKTKSTTKPNLVKPNLRKINVKSNPSLSWAWPSSAPVCLNFWETPLKPIFV